VEDDDRDERSVSDIGAGPEEESQEVLQVFGLKLKVYNPRLAELLTMDARDALGADVVELVKRESGDVDVESIPSVAAGPVKTAASHESDTETQELLMEQVAAVGSEEPVAAPAAPAPSGQESVSLMGEQLGFAVQPGGIWRSSTGVVILVRRLEHPVPLDVATRLARELGEAQQRQGREAAGLFVVDDQMAADVFRVAIRQSGLYHEMRVISMRHLEEILQLRKGGRLSHRQVVSLMVPLTNIDVGELLNVVAAMGRSLDDTLPSV
jgi:hypothetical protein